MFVELTDGIPNYLESKIFIISYLEYDMTTRNKKVELVFARSKSNMDMYLPKVKEEFFQIFSTDVDEVGEWFKQYDIDSMELKIGSVIDTAETTRLLIGFKGENG
jgi:hypothetical protein